MNQSLKPDELYYRKQIYAALITTVAVYIFFVPFCIFALGEQDNGPLVLRYGSVAWGALLVLFLFFSKLWINNLSYVIKENSITIYKGIFTKIEQNIPNSKVTDFVLYRDLLDRFLGVGSIKVQTAGASGESGFEGILNGILDYGEVHRNLRDRLLDSQAQSSNATAKGSGSQNDEVLSDILTELRKINKKLN